MKHVITTNLLVFFIVTINVNTTLVPQGIDEYPKQPVWSGYLADPFAFEFNGTYYIIGTGLGASENKDTFPSLISDDLVTWNYSGDVLPVSNQLDQPSAFWAPEIAQNDGIFYLFYSVGFNDTRHRLRVATSHSPLGPYNDSQSIELTDVTKLSFAIDPHPFRDIKDGQWYLFYSRDFLDTNNGYRVGTGIVVDRLVDNMTRLAGNETTVLRAKHDWQIYERNRFIYNHTYDWHTLEGAATWQQESGTYICFYSGGNWQDTTYGVDYSIAYSSPMGPYTEDSTNQARITHSIKGIIIGPGHNSIIEGRDGQSTYIVYHAWNEAKPIRSPYVSRLNWKTMVPNNSSSGQDILHVTLLFLVYIVVILLIFHHAL
jgi:beta-xylosidase